MARILAQTQNKLDFDAVLNDGRILLVNLSKSQLGEENSRFLGSVLLARMTAAIFKRDPRRPEKLRRFHVIIDEFHNLITSSFPKLFTDGRKFTAGLAPKLLRNYWPDTRLGIEPSATPTGRPVSRYRRCRVALC